jgi:anaerobic dimethyl sulfoxide reductase subunit A
MKIKAPDALLAAEVSRRGLMKTTAIGGLALASSALTLPFTRWRMPPIRRPRQ